MLHRFLIPALVALALVAAPVAGAETLFSESFDSDLGSFGAFMEDGKWQSHYVNDTWRTDLNGGVSAAKDDGCQCQGGGGSCEFLVYQNGTQSDPYDNHITHKPPEGQEWYDYEFSVRLKNKDNDTLGVLFRYQNTANFYAILMSRDRFPGENGCDQFVSPMTQLVKITNSERTILAEVDDCYTQNTEQQINIVVVGPAIEVYLDGDLLISGEDASEDPYLFGGIGLMMIQNGADENQCAGGDCWFDDVLVTGIEDDSDIDEDGLLDEDDNCPKVFNPQQLDFDQDGLGDACDGDDDNDGVPDTLDNCPFLADAPPGDFDGDGIGDACDSDDDNDGLPDDLETGKVGDQDPDTTTDPLDADSDDDGIPDGEEDANKNGKVDEGETDPNFDEGLLPPVDEGGEDAGTEPDVSPPPPDIIEEAVSPDVGPEDIPAADEGAEDDVAAEDVGGDDAAAVPVDVPTTDLPAGEVVPPGPDTAGSDTKTDAGVNPKPKDETIVFGEEDEGCAATTGRDQGAFGLAFLTLMGLLAFRRRRMTAYPSMRRLAP